jgi:ABC-type transport system involved in cytochrome bd biosynthesis fused ATPase/permease subunit
MEFQQAFFILLLAPDFYLPLRNLSLRYHAGMNGLTAAGRSFKSSINRNNCSLQSALNKETELS